MLDGAPVIGAMQLHMFTLTAVLCKISFWRMHSQIWRIREYKQFHRTRPTRAKQTQGDKQGDNRADKRGESFDTNQMKRIENESERQKWPPALTPMPANKAARQIKRERERETQTDHIQGQTKLGSKVKEPAEDKCQRDGHSHQCWERGQKNVEMVSCKLI